MINVKTLISRLLTNKLRLSVIALLSFFAGTVNGFLGTGGGIVLMFALSLLPTKGNDEIRDRFATVIAVILPLSLISLFAYDNSFDMSVAVPYILPGMAGGVAGALLLDKISVRFVKKLFALMIIWAGLNFIW